MFLGDSFIGIFNSNLVISNFGSLNSNSSVVFVLPVDTSLNIIGINVKPVTYDSNGVIILP